MDVVQPGILEAPPQSARFLTFSLHPDPDVPQALDALRDLADGAALVVGIGPAVTAALGRPVEGLRNFPRHTGPGFDVPSTAGALWCWLRGDDRGDLLMQAHEVRAALACAFELDDSIDAFQYREGLDLTGYVDGTENPEGDAALAAAIVKGQGPGLDGSSFVAVQQWRHDLARFQSLPQSQRDETIGRRLSDNEEIEDAPASAHVKRTAQETFDPEAFVLRRSMPWADAVDEGLVFVAFGSRFDAFEALLRRMVGDEDGIVDALFTFTRPLTGTYYWCPPLAEGRLDLRALGL